MYSRIDQSPVGDYDQSSRTEQNRNSTCLACNWQTVDLWGDHDVIFGSFGSYCLWSLSIWHAQIWRRKGFEEPHYYGARSNVATRSNVGATFACLIWYCSKLKLLEQLMVVNLVPIDGGWATYIGRDGYWHILDIFKRR